MIIVQIQNAVKEYNGTPLFDPVSFEINEHERVALIGPNGTGKSTIIKMIIGEEKPDSGLVSVGKNFRLGYLSQGVISSLGHTLYEEAEEVFANLMEMEKGLQSICRSLEKDPGNEELLDAYSKTEAKFAHLGGYDYRYKIDTMLGKFGFSKRDFSRSISSFSGGERMKMAFAKLLLLKPDLLLLDEPTNHLDIDTIEWLESYLKTYPGSVLFVSHDRYFINALATKILELDQRRIELYVGDYDKYSSLKKERYEQRLKAYKLQQAEIKKLEWFITYYMPKPRFVSRAHDREKKLARIKRLEAPKVTQNRINISMKGEIRSGKKVISIENLGIGYDSTLVSGITMLVEGGDRWAILGANGSGKTTFVKTINGELEPKEGKCNFLTDVKIGYLRQDGINLKSSETVFAYFREAFLKLSNQEIYDHLGKYSFAYEEANEKIIDQLSGGERMRVVIAHMSLCDYDLLILDEPTNHLDMMTKEELIEALKLYRGTILLVSHDRYFVDRVADKLIYFYNQKAFIYEGQYSEFKVEKLDPMVNREAEERYTVKERKTNAFKSSTEVMTPKSELQPSKRKMAKNKIEEKMERIERLLEEKNSLLDDPTFYWDRQKMSILEEEIKSLEYEYNELMEQLALYDNN